MEPEGSLPYTEEQSAGSYPSQLNTLSTLPLQFFNARFRSIPWDV
jgi:hypothetical protein